MGSCLAELGEPGRARPLLERALARTRELGLRRILGYTLQAQGSVAECEGDDEGAAKLQDEARRHLTEAANAARALGQPPVLVPALAWLALAGEDPAAAVEALREHGEHVPHLERMDARWTLWRATGDAAHLEAARRLLDDLVAHSPPECREAMLERVPLYREITAG